MLEKKFSRKENLVLWNGKIIFIIKRLSNGRYYICGSSDAYFIFDIKPEYFTNKDKCFDFIRESLINFGKKIYNSESSPMQLCDKCSGEGKYYPKKSMFAVDCDKCNKNGFINC